MHSYVRGKYLLIGLKLLAWLCGVFMVLILAQPLLAKETCSVNVVEFLDGFGNALPAPSCKELSKATRTLNKKQYAKFFGRVYRIEELVPDKSARCLIGLLCLSQLATESNFRNVNMTELDGALNFDQLASYLDGEYIGDGTSVFYKTMQVSPLNPPFDLHKIRYLGKASVAAEKHYVTDGKWVLYKGEIVYDVQPDNFRIIHFPDGWEVDAPMFARDDKSVFYGPDHLTDADPVSFRFAELPGKYGEPGKHYAIDRDSVWELSRVPLLMRDEDALLIRQSLKVVGKVDKS